jgi:hypothetical protein
MEEFEGKHPDLILYTEVRLLSKGKVLARFLSLIEEIKDFLKSKNADLTNVVTLTSYWTWLSLPTSLTKRTFQIWSFREKTNMWLTNYRLCKIIQSRTSLVDVTYEDEVSRTVPKYEENGR